MNELAQPYFEPFVGGNYWVPTKFPGRLLILGESHYLRTPEKDNRTEFIKDLVEEVSHHRSMTANWPTPYYRQLFYLLTGKRARDIKDSEWKTEWENTWQSLAFYNFVQTSRLRRPLERPTKDEWEKSIIPFRMVLSDLRPEYVLITGRIVTAYATRGAIKQEGIVGVWLPTAEGAYAFARCIYHPSSRQSASRREQQRQLITEMFGQDRPVPIQA